MIKIVHFWINSNNKASVVPEGGMGGYKAPAQQNAPVFFSPGGKGGGFPWQQKQIKIEKTHQALKKIIKSLSPNQLLPTYI